jgi:hypothetical protein
MYKQLRDWMIYGILSDKYSEFYISLNENITDSVELEKKVRNQDDELGIGGFTVSQLNEIEDLLIGGKFNSNYSLHKLNSTMLPSYLNFKTAGKILFTGEALQLFKPKFIRQTELKINQTLDEQLQKKFHIHDDSNRVLKAEFSIMNEQLDEFSREMHELAQKEEFSIVKFDAYIDKVRNFVSQVHIK